MTAARADPGPPAGDRGTDGDAGAGGSGRGVGPGIRGILLAAAVCGTALLLPVPRRYDVLAALLALIAGVYVGFASDAPVGERRLQWAVALATWIATG